LPIFPRLLRPCPVWISLLIPDLTIEVMGRIIRLGMRPVKARSRVSNESICGPLIGETFSSDIAHAVSLAEGRVRAAEGAFQMTAE
jgi:hypothetical protein